MPWSYSGNPANSSKDAIRFEIGDVLAEDPLLEDEEINYVLTVESSHFAASARCCEAIASKFAREADRKLGPQSINASQKARAYIEKAKSLRIKSTGYSAPYAGGISKTDQEQEEANLDTKSFTFTRNMMSPSDSSDDLTK